MGHEGGGWCIVVGVVNLQNTLRTPMSQASDDVLMQHGAHIQASRIALALRTPTNPCFQDDVMQHEEEALVSN